MEGKLTRGGKHEANYGWEGGGGNMMQTLGGINKITKTNLMENDMMENSMMENDIVGKMGGTNMRRIFFLRK